MPHFVNDDLPVLDVNVLRALVGSDDDILSEVVREYQKSLSNMSVSLRAGFSAGDLKEVAALAHKLKSASRTVGALRLGEFCGELERPAAVTSAAEVSVAFEQLLANTEHAVSDFLSGRAP